MSLAFRRSHWPRGSICEQKGMVAWLSSAIVEELGAFGGLGPLALQRLMNWAAGCACKLMHAAMRNCLQRPAIFVATPSFYLLFYLALVIFVLVLYEKCVSQLNVVQK
ncbi:hypothetical protein K458DRAFT_20079 [Lentithecium fluviatile CBS 122367]|uniref:Uncharacterized protein n=1 Tax=Lentithecium fluviatile CBS 122367 TaxID=1168545 RepID=A0A6G1J4E6_9PLEO|nr:hypothetical protein K458DRAFT_20079 [Lentithecium fluviatile CBS 122367]